MNAATDSVEEMKKLAKTWAETHQKTVDNAQQFAPLGRSVCPHCGYCPHCGRGGQHAQPWPYYPNTWGPWYITSGSITGTQTPSVVTFQNGFNT